MVVWLFEMLLDRDVLIPVSSSDRRRRSDECDGSVYP